MLKRLSIKNFTVFSEASFEFGPGLNVVIGTNGTGKSHVLKLGYIAARVTAKILGGGNLAPGPENWQHYLAQRLKDIFQPVELGKLVSWSAKKGTASVEVEFSGNTNNKLYFSFAATAKQPVLGGKQPISVTQFPKRLGLSWAIFIPPKEVLTLSWIRNIYKTRVLPIDDVYPSLLDLLAEVPLRDSEISPEINEAIDSIKRIVGGQVEQVGERYYLVSKQHKTEIELVAEGMRKFAMLERLLRNGILTPDSILFWDEPEANLNPALLKKLAVVLVELARLKFQIILGTHSSFLLKELHILSHKQTNKPLPIRYFGLNAAPGEATQVTTTDDFEEMPDIVALDEELSQAGEFLDVLNNEQ